MAQVIVQFGSTSRISRIKWIVVIDMNMNMRMSSRLSLDILIQKFLLYTILMTPYPEIKMSCLLNELKRVKSKPKNVPNRHWCGKCAPTITLDVQTKS